MATLGSTCPRCGMPTYVTGICTHDDCNYPAGESNNARRSRERAEAHARAQRKQAQAASKARTKTEGATSKSKDGVVDGLGRFGAAAGGIAAAMWAHGAAPDAPVLWAVAGVLAAALVYALRKLIIAGAAVAGLAVIFLGDDDAPGRAADAAAPVLAPAATARVAQAVAAPVDVIGLCLRNATGAAVDFSFAAPGGPQGTPERLEAGDERLIWALESQLDTPDAHLVVRLPADGTHWNLPLRSIVVRPSGNAVEPEDLTCGPSGLVAHHVVRRRGETVIVSPAG